MAALAAATPRTRLLAGGTDLVRELRSPGSEPDLLIDLTGLAELAAVRLDGETLRVGALCTFTQLQWDPLVREHALCLSLAAAQVGLRADPQRRHHRRQHRQRLAVRRRGHGAHGARRRR